MNLLLLILCHLIVSNADSNSRVLNADSNRVKLEVSIAKDKMILKCVVQNYQNQFSIFLNCPLGVTCKENCKKTCLDTRPNKCLADKMIQCNEIGFLENTNTYIIEYVIDGTNPINNGKWNCSFTGNTSPPITVEAPIIPINNYTTTTKLSTKKKIIKTTGKILKTHVNQEPERPPFFGNILTKSEFILSVIGLLAVSLIFNIIFCSRLMCDKCKFKKTAYINGDYFSMPPNVRPFNRCNSQVSDPERIYEDTSTTQRQMSFMTKIKNSNGNYVGQSTLTPSSGPTTLLPPHYLPLNHSMSFPNSQSDGINPLINTPNQIYYPLPIDSTQTNYGAVGLNPENQYTNFVSVQPELTPRDANNQPLYLAFTPAPQFVSPNGRYIQYSQPPLHMTAESTTSSNTRPSPVPSQVKNGPVSRSNSEQDNYKLSREMMEEADNLLRTADTLLKSTQQEMNKIHS